MLFLSTLSLRRATHLQVGQKRFLQISIHALLAESDMFTGILPHHARNFYPRSPCGERHVANRTTDIIPPFLSTLSLRRATVPSSTVIVILRISIHALLAESDLLVYLALIRYLVFLSTLSLRRATVGAPEGADFGHISIHALLAESDLMILSRPTLVN